MGEIFPISFGKPHPGAIEVKHVAFNLGLNPQGAMVQNRHVATPTKRLWVIPGKLAVMENRHPTTNALTVYEIPLGPFGWEYEAKE